MAGIGFVLRKLTAKDDLGGVARAFMHSALASAGPWLFTVVALWGVYLGTFEYRLLPAVAEFRLVIIYNFCFSLVFTGPIFMVATRYLADAIYQQDMRDITGSFVGSVLLAFVTQLPILIWFYGYYLDIDPSVRILGVVNFLEISAIWIAGVYMMALKDYISVSFAFAAGMVVAVISILWLGFDDGTPGMLFGFTAGLGVTLFFLIALIFNQYTGHSSRLFSFWRFFGRYWELALCGLVYNAAIWVDKWIMWLYAPERAEHAAGFISYPDYDGAMFLSYLLIVPSMALFIFSVETSFFQHYLKFYRDILNHANLKKIQQNNQGITYQIFSNTRNFIILQGSVSLVAYLMAPKIFEWFDINYLQMGMFRYGVLGTFFHALALFLMIVLSYFDNRWMVLLLQLLFLGSNALFTFMFVDKGFAYYGVGYFLSALLVFFFAAVATLQYLRNLPYHAFITNNTSVGR